MKSPILTFAIFSLIGWQLGVVVACSRPKLTQVTEERGRASVIVANGTGYSTVVHLAFGADSKVLPEALPFCLASGALTCAFPLAAHAEQSLPLAGKYLNVTLAFNAPVGCGSTKAELNLNNPKWYDTLDVSLVDGYSNDVKIEADKVTLGPNLPSGNERVLGVFPLGCDVCTARQSPPCGIAPGTNGCKSGTQYKPDVICQWQGAVKDGSTAARVTLVK